MFCAVKIPSFEYSAPSHSIPDLPAGPPSPQAAHGEHCPQGTPVRHGQVPPPPPAPSASCCSARPCAARRVPAALGHSGAWLRKCFSGARCAPGGPGGPVPTGFETQCFRLQRRGGWRMSQR